MEGSLDPPSRTTFFGGGQGFKAAGRLLAGASLAEPGWVGASLAPGLVGAIVVDPASGFAESAGLLGAGFSAVGESEQGTAFL